jgi:hypothetical protein
VSARRDRGEGGEFMMLRKSDAGRRAGTVVVLVAFSIVAILSMLALSLDGGVLVSERRHAQATADAAAMAGAGMLYYDFWANSGHDPAGTAKAAALAAAAQNGYANDGSTTTVTVNIPPQSGFYAGRWGYVETIVQYNEPRGFSSLFGSGPVPVIASSVAVGMPIAGDVGILVLDPSAKDALSANGGGTLNVLGTPIINNSANSEGSIANGGTVVTAPEFDLTGNYATLGGGAFNGTINLNRPPTADPLQYLPVPDPTTMTKQSNKKVQYTNGDNVLYPGVYKGGINASGTANVVLMPGVYYMEGGGFGFSGQGNLTANGVMIYNAPANGNSDSVSVTGSGVINISGPTSGVYQGLSFWQDRTSSVTATISGGAGSSLTGTFYFAGAQLNVSGGAGNINLGSQYISNQLNISGGGTMNVQWTPYTVARRRMITLVE